MPDVIQGSIYDYPKYYDLLFGSDWKAEYDFLSACFQKHARRRVRGLFEPACGTGRLLVKFAEAGFDVSGIDLNPLAIDYCNARFQRRGFDPAALVGDMADYRLNRKVDAAFNTISSFRHLPNEHAAASHLKCVADSLAKGGVYVLGLHLTPTSGPRSQDEQWSARRGNLAILSYMWSKHLDRKRRKEFLGMTLDIYTPIKHLRIEDEMIYRTYTARQMTRLLGTVPELEVAATYDFAYEIENPLPVGPDTEDVVYVLRKR